MKTEPVTALGVLRLESQREAERLPPLPPELEHAETDPVLLRTAVNEDGHAVAQLVLNYGVYYASIQPRIDDLGRVQPRYPLSAPVRDRVLVALAGAAAEKVHCPVLSFDEVQKLDAHDLVDACFLLARERKVLPTAPIVAADLERYRPTAAKLVRAHWGWVRRVAAALVVARRLTGDQILALKGTTR